MNQKILIFISRILCYESNYFFVSEIEKELCNLGFEVEVCETNGNEADLEEMLMQYVGKTFRAIIDMNSRLQRLEMDEGGRYLDQIDAPFYNYIVDHPLYHHPVIKIGLKNSNIICIDRNHVDYIKKYYPGIKNTIFMPLGAMEAFNHIPYEERKIDVLFAGTYEPSQSILEQIMQSAYQVEIMDMIALLKSKVWMTQEEALKVLQQQNEQDKNQDEFGDKLNSYYLVDKYLRAYYRELLIELLLEHKIKVTVLGYGWETFNSLHKEYLIIKEHVSFPISLEIMANSKIVLNIMPWFKDGIHDRVLCAMANQAVCITDSSSYIEEQFVDGKDLMLYSIDKMKQVPPMIADLLLDTNRAKQIALCGYQKVKKKHMWKNRLEETIERII